MTYITSNALQCSYILTCNSKRFSNYIVICVSDMNFVLEVRYRVVKLNGIVSKLLCKVVPE